MEVAWLLEANDRSNRYRCIVAHEDSDRPEDRCLTADPWKALRFKSRDEAHAHAVGLSYTRPAPGLVPVQHAFLRKDPSPAPTPEEILPCPFCGGTDIDLNGCSVEYRGGEGTSAVCSKCDCCGPKAANSDRASRRAWNRRAAEEPLRAEVERLRARDSQPVQLVLAEVARATAKFPTWPTDPLHALAVLGEEFGELTKAVMQATYEPHKATRADVRDEAVQTAAMALRFVASLDTYAYGRCQQHEQAALASAEKGGAT